MADPEGFVADEEVPRGFVPDELPPIKLSPYEQYRMSGREPVAGPFGPASPEEVPAMLEAAQRPFIPLPENIPDLLEKTRFKGTIPAAYKSVVKPVIEGIESPAGVLMAPMLAESAAARVAAGIGFGGMAAKSGLDKMQSADPQTQLEGRMEFAASPLFALAGGKREKGATPTERIVPEATPAPPEALPKAPEIPPEKAPPTEAPEGAPPTAPATVEASGEPVAAGPPEPAKVEPTGNVPVAQPGAENPIVGMGGAVPEEVSPTGTGLKNAVGELERVGLGLQEAPETTQRSMAAAWEQSAKVESAAPGSGKALADSLIADPERGLTDSDSALLLRHKVDLFNKMNDAAERTQIGDAAARKQAQSEYDVHKGDYEQLLDAVKSRGAEWGREGRWRQAMAKEDFSFTSRDEFNRYHKALNGGKDLPEGKLPKASQLADDNKRAQNTESQAEQKLNNQIKTVRGKTPEEKAVWEAAQKYLENNKGLYGFDDIRNRIATDLGMTAQQVTYILAKDSKTKRLADDFWNAQRNSRRLREQAKNWVRSVNTPGWQRALASIPRTMFSISVGIHGTVALGTHAPMVAYQPQFWNSYFRNFGKMYKMVFSPAYYESQMADLVRKPDYIKFRRAGLQNDPFQYEEYHTGTIRNIVKNIAGERTADLIDKFTSSGNRGYSVLKLLRQDMADQLWGNLPDTTKLPEMAKGLSGDINHVTGVTQKPSPPGAHIGLFAPRLLGSRVMWLTADPAKMLMTFAKWNTATPVERQLAMNQLKEKASVFATFAGLLAINQGLLSASGSKQKINGIPKTLGGGGIDPLSSDFMKFKASGMDVAYGSAMLNMAKLPVRMATAIMYEGKTSKLIMEDERVYNIALGYMRTQLSPAAGTVADLAFGRDYAERPLPRKGFGLLPGETSMPKRMRAQGTRPYTWEEYLAERFTPIPISEGLREVFKGRGVPDSQIDTYIKAFAISSIMAGTGTRITEDTKNVKR